MRLTNDRDWKTRACSSILVVHSLLKINLQNSSKTKEESSDYTLFFKGFFIPSSSGGSDRIGTMSITFARRDFKVAAVNVHTDMSSDMSACYLLISMSKGYAHTTSLIGSFRTIRHEES
ncbi:hypothetical protein POM88_029412 [Heracleum sosnowskyi]|uniref:Uncharacterized protein n=1 Tax=Heracleum sosnowskyi TaxID=360622 RepID=A0AAD8MHN2_9APIA|nr:hypothetical protein POM88_029412 [Heracleum sosnowskyi]